MGRATMNITIPFNKPFLIGRELDYIKEAVASGKISGNGAFTARCHRFFETTQGFRKVLLTSSCTDALELAALLLDLKPGDEVIMPSYTFVSTANAFVLRGAVPVFADSEACTPNIDPDSVAGLISPRTKAIVVVHYAGISCDMGALQRIAAEHRIPIVEDAAHAVDSFYNRRRLGSLGNLAAFSFHETKNIISGEGGMLAVNDPALVARAEILWEKGTNRVAFSRGEVDKYNWVDVGSSFLPSEVIAAFLFAQLEELPRIQAKRISLWHAYRERLYEAASRYGFALPHVPPYATVNGHLFYLVCPSRRARDGLIGRLGENGVLAVFHYLPLHESPYYSGLFRPTRLPNAEHFKDCLVRLPLFYELSLDQVGFISRLIIDFFAQHRE